MNKSKDYKFLVQNISSLKGVGAKTKLLLKRKKTGDKKLDEFTEKIWNSRNTLPFSPRWYLDDYKKEELDKILDKLVSKKIMRVYPELLEANGSVVAQFEHTITPTENGVIVLTKT